ncbi:MAG: hypothetical protein Ct9H300mP16_16860 [Pseudomonadota bacterium]|nr:MAG: hypothetical protein Ct9H300mP16_16860 [Pseudomonadota bacterium]
MPTFRDPDALIYGREEVGGLLIGFFDRNAKPGSPAELPGKNSRSGCSMRTGISLARTWSGHPPDSRAG